MSVTAITTFDQNLLGKYLKIVSTNSVYSQLPDQSVMWKTILKKKKGPAEGRELRYLLRSAYGMAASQFMGLSGDVAYPSGHRATIVEGTCTYKDFALTIELERTLIQKAMSGGDKARYAEPLAEEIKCKTIGMSRMLSAAMYQDGTGRIGKVLTPSVSSGRLAVVLDTTVGHSHVGWFEWGDKVKFVSSAGAAQNVTVSSGSISYYAVADISRSTDTVTIAAYDSSGTELTVSAVNEISAGDFVLRTGITANDYGSISSSTEYGTLSEAIVGLDAITDSNIKLHGVTQNRPIAATVKNCGGNTIDSQHFQEGLSQLKVAVGEGVYKWSDAIMAPEVLDSLVESRETDRRFMSIQDNKKGVASLGYVHGKDTVMFSTDEFCPKQRIYVMPSGSDVLIFRGSSFEWVKPEGGTQWHLKPLAGGHYRTMRAYMEGTGTLYCTHPASILKLTDFAY